MNYGAQDCPTDKVEARLAITIATSPFKAANEPLPILSHAVSRVALEHETRPPIFVVMLYVSPNSSLGVRRRKS
jgi:hypothetical protein